VSLKESIPKAKFKEINVSIQGINGGDMRIKEGIMLQVNDSAEMLFYVVENLPRNLDIILGQEWLFQNDYIMTCPNTILPFSESIIKVPFRERERIASWGLLWQPLATSERPIFCLRR
jgi:hypothetical protein